MQRRDWILGGVVGSALAVGAGWWRHQNVPRSEPDLPNAGPDQQGPGGVSALWSVRLPQPDGEELAFDTLRGRPLVINFWATWCPPCVKEMPLLDGFARRHPELVVVGVAVDKAEAVRSFLTRTPVAFRIGVAGFAGSALARQLGNAQGALPFSVAVDRAGRIVGERLGEIHPDELAAWAKRLGV